MKRRRTRRARSRFVIGSGGLTRPKTVALKVGRIYSMGASSSPEAIRVLSVTDEHIRYRAESQYRDQKPMIIQRWIGEDLIATGEATFRKHYGVSTHEWHTMTEDEREPHVRKMLGR